MSAIHRYLLSELSKTFAASLAVFTLLLIAVGAFREARTQGLEPAQACCLLPYVLPDALRFAVPGVTLLSVCLVYGRASAAGEFTALKAAGIHPLRILSPIVPAAVLLSLATIGLNELAISWGRWGVCRVVLESVEDLALSTLRARRSYSSAEATIVVRDVVERRLIRPTISFRTPQGPAVLVAEEAELRAKPDEGRLTIVCRNGEFDVAGRGRILFPNGELERSVPMPWSGAMDDKHPSHVPLLALSTAVAEHHRRMEVRRDELAAKAVMQLAAGDFDALAGKEWKTNEVLIGRAVEHGHRLETEPHRRWAAGFSCLCFALVGAPLAVRMRNADLLTGFFLCFVPILVLYYPLLATGVEHAKTGRWPPESVWLGNALLTVAAAWQLRRMVRY